MFSDVWSENVALFKRWLKIHSNPPVLYYGFNMFFHTMGFTTTNSASLIYRVAQKKQNIILPAICGCNNWYHCMR